MPQVNQLGKAEARVDMMNAMSEILTRMRELANRTEVLASAMLGSEDDSRQPTEIMPASLDAKIFGLYDPLTSIEDHIANLLTRLGAALPFPSPNKSIR